MGLGVWARLGLGQSLQFAWAGLSQGALSPQGRG